LKQDIFWLGWCQLHKLLSEKFGETNRTEQVAHGGSERLVYDLYRLLERKGLRYYRGYMKLKAPDDLTVYPGVWEFFRLRKPTIMDRNESVFWEAADGC
jgi:hypothetical protein